MSPGVLYRIAAVLLVLFALGHQFGFRQVDPAWHAEGVAGAMQTTSFTAQGFRRTYWEFYSGFGFLVTILLLLSALLAWELARRAGGPQGSAVRWALALAYVAIAIVTWTHFFVAPGVFATLIAGCLMLAALTHGRTGTTTRETVERYFEKLQSNDGWDAALAPGLAFTSYASPNREIRGKDAYLRGTQRFYSMIAGVEVREMLVDGGRACALTRYALQPPNGGPGFSSDVAEVFAVRDGKIESFAIYFDTSPYPR